MLSFIRGTWSFISRIFRSRINSGFSPTDMKKPTNERNMRDKRLHIQKAPFPRLLYGVIRWSRRRRGPAGRDRIHRNEIGYGIRDLLFLFLLLRPPGEESILLLGDGLIVSLDTGAVLGGDAVHLCLDLLIFLQFAGLQFGQGFLLHAFEGIQGPIPFHGVLNDVFKWRAGCL